jgi:hypothetical protein
MLETPFSWAHGLNLTLAGYSQFAVVLLVTRLPTAIPVKQSSRTARPIRTRLMLPCVATRFSAVREY